MHIISSRKFAEEQEEDIQLRSADKERRHIKLGIARDAHLPQTDDRNEDP